MKSKVLRYLTVLILLLIMLICGTSLTNAASYSDIAGTTYQTAVETLSSMGIIGGNPDGTYQPFKNVTRAEFSAMITRFLGVPDSALTGYTKTNFKDMAGYSWSIPYFGFCAERGIITGDGKGNAMPGSTITYGQAVTMLVRTLGLESELNPSLDWPTNYIDVASKHGLTDNVKASDGVINRGNAAILLYNALIGQENNAEKLKIKNITFYRNVDNKLVRSDQYARNIDDTLYLNFDVNYDLLENDATIKLEIQARPQIEKKTLESKFESIKLDKDTTTKNVSTEISISNLVKDNDRVNGYMIVIKSGNEVLGQSSFTLFIDSSAEEAFMGTVKVSEIKFYSGEKDEWIAYADREYASTFKWSPTLGMIGTELHLTYDNCPDDYSIPINIKYDMPNGYYADFTPTYDFTKGSTLNIIDGYVYFSQFDAKKYQPGSYTVEFYAYGKKIGSGSFVIE